MPTKKRTGGFNDPIEVVEQFRTDIEYWFVRFQNFYDRSNAAMRNYRLAHVALIADLYQSLMFVFGDDIHGVIEMTRETQEIIDRVQGEGNPNACLTGVIGELETLNVRVGAGINACAIRANQTFSDNLRNLFYPAFVEIQATISPIPNSVTDALSRGNVLEDETAIIAFLRARYESNEFQFVNAVSQLLRWETSRFENESLWIIDEMTVCNALALIQFIVDVIPLQTRAAAC